MLRFTSAKNVQETAMDTNHLWDLPQKAYAASHSPWTSPGSETWVPNSRHTLRSVRWYLQYAKTGKLLIKFLIIT